MTTGTPAPRRVLTRAEWLLLAPAVALCLYGVARHIWNGPWQ